MLCVLTSPDIYVSFYRFCGIFDGLVFNSHHLQVLVK